MNSQNAAYHPCLKPAVVVTGTANEGTAGAAIGHVDIGVSDAAYLFRIAVPGLRRIHSEIFFSSVIFIIYARLSYLMHKHSFLHWYTV